MFLFYELQIRLTQYLTRPSIFRIAEAFLVAADAHETQFRSSGEPYITHPVAVACLLADMHLDPEAIMVALMHDVVEDTDITEQDLANQFGPKIAELVDGVTKLTKIRFETKAHAQAENVRKMMLAMVRDIRVIVIKLADRLHNMRTLGALKPEKKRRIAEETLEVYVPLAHRMGMNAIKVELEALCFEALYPLRCRVLEKCVMRAQGSRQKLMSKLHQTLTERLAQEGILGDHITGREKRLYSIYRKMQYRHIPFSEIMDVYGFRVIAKTEQDCYRLLGVVHSIFKPIPGRFKDYIAIPKANGYQSLHTTLFGPHGVPVEVQIRTTEMDHIAEQGIAAHWLYKSEGRVSETELKMHQWLTRLMDIQKNNNNPLAFMEEVKIDLFPDEVYVFTPKGDIMALPRGATVLDFAYSVHTKVGGHCVGAKVNRRPVPLSEVLVSGQTVEVLTEPNASPDPAWLSIVVTGKAKGAIRQYLKEDKQSQTIALGQRLLEYSLSESAITWDQVPAIVKRVLLSDMQLLSDKKLFEHIGLGERSGTQVAHHILELMGKTNPHATQAGSFTISGAEGVSVQYADCCYPLPGDPVQGIVQPGQGIEIHEVHCQALKEKTAKLPPENMVSLNWANDTKGVFRAKLVIETENKPGILAAIAQVIAQDQVNIESIAGGAYARSMAKVNVIMTVENRAQLARVIRRIRQERYVTRVTRQKYNDEKYNQQELK